MKDGARVVFVWPAREVFMQAIHRQSGAQGGRLTLVVGMLGRALYLDKTPRRKARLWWVEWDVAPGRCVLIDEQHMEET